jgi:hypothetical protein
MINNKQQLRELLLKLPLVLPHGDSTWHGPSGRDKERLIDRLLDGGSVPSYYVRLDSLALILQRPEDDTSLDNYDTDGVAPDQQKPETD